MAYGDVWFMDKKRSAERCIKKWEKWYAEAPMTLRVIIEHYHRDEKSPGKKAAFKEWLESHCEICGSIDSIDDYYISADLHEFVCLKCIEEGR